jgi:hypothetical protein
MRMAREWGRLGAPGRAALNARWTSVWLQGKGLLLGLRSPLALLIRLGVLLAQLIQSRFDLHRRAGEIVGPRSRIYHGCFGLLGCVWLGGGLATVIAALKLLWILIHKVLF